MADPNMTNFRGRVARIERRRGKGHGVGAMDTPRHAPRIRRRSGGGWALRLLVSLLLCGFVWKGAALHALGAGRYALQVANGVPAVAWLLQADPVTRAIATALSTAN